jgi:hypothetical protein
MANCDKFVSQYTEYLDGRLSTQIKSDFDQHIHTCQECAESIRNMRALKSHLKGLTQVKTSDTFHVVLRSRIRQELSKESIPEKIINSFRIYKLPRYVIGFAALILIVFFSYNTLLQPEMGDDSFLSTQLSEETSSYPRSEIITPTLPVYIIEERTEKEKVLSSNENINSKSLQENRESRSFYIDTTKVHQPKPVGVYITVPSTSVAF